VRPIDEPVDAQEKVFGAQQVGKQFGLRGDGAALLLQARAAIVVAMPAGRIAREQHARLFECLATGCDHQRQVFAFWDRFALQRVQPRAVSSRRFGDSREHGGGCVGSRYCATREDPHAAHERELLVSANRQYFNAVRCFA
jgi:hypothetical protein